VLGQVPVTQADLKARLSVRRCRFHGPLPPGSGLDLLVSLSRLYQRVKVDQGITDENKKIFERMFTRNSVHYSLGVGKKFPA
jgi:hypothetical protein